MDLRTRAAELARLAADHLGSGGGADQIRGGIWCHASTGVDIAALLSLLQDLEDIDVIFTASRGVELPSELPGNVSMLMRPMDLQKRMDRFLNEAGVFVALFAGMDFPPLALSACEKAGIPAVLIDARGPDSRGLGRAWADFRMRSRLRHFSRILAVSPKDRTALVRIGANPVRTEASGPLQTTPSPLPCNRGDHDDLSQVIGTRPVWAAIRPVPRELEALEEAHRIASRLSHRLLLIVAAEDAAVGAAMAALFERRGWATARRSQGEEPDPDIQVYIGDAEEEDGLWYRMAPITFLGGSLFEPGGGRTDPMGPAALGSAIICGAYLGPFSKCEARLHEVGASRRVTGGASLGEAVADLLSPDRAAHMAQLAWEATSAGAAVADRVIGVIHEQARRSGQ